MIYYVGPLATMEAVPDTPWVRRSVDDSEGIIKRKDPLDPVPGGVTSYTHEEALTLMETVEWYNEPPE